MSGTIPRPEHPRPQMAREAWLNLNGIWEFERDSGKSGRARKLFLAQGLQESILVPFCPESKLSGLEYKDFMPAVWYQRGFELPDAWSGKSILLHFGAVDYSAEIWINGQAAGTHQGGYASFTLDITEHVKQGNNIITVYVEDDVRSMLQPRGKQSAEYYSHHCDYTRTTGIWQTVWLEGVHPTYIAGTRYTPDPDNGQLHIEATICGITDDCTFHVQTRFHGQDTGRQSAQVTGNQVRLTVQLTEIHLWEPGRPELYDLSLEVTRNGKILDQATSYFGLRSIILKDGAIQINRKPVFQRLVLDQGFYPDGIYTAPTDNDLRRDIELSMDMGFNGARLHQKVFEQRFIYWADRLGYLVWGEQASWGLDITSAKGLEQFLPEWLEVLQRDFNSPAIIGWCPFNETWDLDGRDGESGRRQDDEVLRTVYQVTKALDPTRPVIDTSGNFHVVTDIFDVHDYEQDPVKFARKYEPMAQGGAAYVTHPDRQHYDGQPYFVSEYGGIWWNPAQKDEKGWGYGDRPTSEESFIQRYDGLTSTLLQNPAICAFCYTQLTNVEQEVNGLYTYDRKPKFDPAVIRQINRQKAAIET